MSLASVDPTWTINPPLIPAWESKLAAVSPEALRATERAITSRKCELN